jgi:hypothetical protein
MSNLLHTAKIVLRLSGYLLHTAKSPPTVAVDDLHTANGLPTVAERFAVCYYLLNYIHLSKIYIPLKIVFLFL